MMGSLGPRSLRTRLASAPPDAHHGWLPHSHAVKPRRGTRDLLPPHASKGDKDKNDKADIRKADTSAYWALKVREFFSPRKKYLDQAKEKLGEEEPEILKRIEQELDEDKAQIDKLQEERLQLHMEWMAAARQAQAEEVTQPGAAPPPPAENVMTREQLMAWDLEAARTDVHRKLAATSWKMTARRMQALVLEMVTLPIRVVQGMRQGWVRMFESQRYENFLMAEGERIWYWRNRTENERWFWEIYAWEHLAFPIICAVSYQMLVPSNFVWAVIIPFAFIYWQTGQVPGPNNLEFWLVGYFGFWRKCWPGLSAFLLEALRWA